jgi:hypothetical protein
MKSSLVFLSIVGSTLAMPPTSQGQGFEVLKRENYFPGDWVDACKEEHKAALANCGDLDKYSTECMAFKRKGFFLCVINRAKAPETSNEKHNQCRDKAFTNEIEKCLNEDKHVSWDDCSAPGLKSYQACVKQA